MRGLSRSVPTGEDGHSCFLEPSESMLHMGSLSCQPNGFFVEFVFVDTQSMLRARAEPDSIALCSQTKNLTLASMRKVPQDMEHCR